MRRIRKGGEAYDCGVMVREWDLLPNIYSLKATLSSIIRWFKRMSEAIISRRGYTAEGKPEWHTETITGSTTWTVPKNNQRQYQCIDIWRRRKWIVPQ